MRDSTIYVLDILADKGDISCLPVLVYDLLPAVNKLINVLLCEVFV